MLIASLAAMRAREATLQEVLRSLLAQTRPPDRIVVHYSEEPWHLDAGWAQPPRVPEHPCIELCKVANVGSMRKYLFTANAYRDANATIVLVDDDRVWHPAVFDRLVDFVHKTNCV
ncbi:MAG: glycosyltransferase, partial [Pseudomonadota bacterium]